MINIDEHTNRVLNIVKAKFGLPDKSQAIILVTKQYEKEFLEPVLRPEFLLKLEKIKKGKYHKFSSIAEARKAVENEKL